MATDLKAFQARLNSDKAFRSEFLKDPVKTLAAEGIVLPDAAKKHLTGHVAELTAKRRVVPGSTLDLGGKLNIIVNIASIGD